jgi:peptidoglycan LD-endopeptidase LytH
MYNRTHSKIHPIILFMISTFLIFLIVIIYFIVREKDRTTARSIRLMSWFRDPQAHSDWEIVAGERCEGAAFIFPTDGYIGFLWGDSFRPGHTHQGIDIFGSPMEDRTPIIAAYDGYLTRLPDWKSSIIIRIPDDPLHPGRQIWTYYTHMASSQGESYIEPTFPPGTYDVFVEQGIRLGYQGNYSGSPGNPTGIHLHFSIVLDDGQGGFRNELAFKNTIDPSPYFNMQLNAATNQDEIPRCEKLMNGK